jgi:hypothetical protein
MRSGERREDWDEGGTGNEVRGTGGRKIKWEDAEEKKTGV